MNNDSSCHITAALGSANHVVVLTGAGVSAESGLPTFRDNLTGLWAQYDPTQLATPDAFRRDPALVWGWYEWRRMMDMQALPNLAHKAIAELAHLVPKLTVITQNVDSLHERAGSSEVIHLHGSLHQPRCFACAKQFFLAEYPDEPAEGRKLEPPRCEKCNGKIRPGVVWFGEKLPKLAVQTAFKAARECDILLSIGTSGMVYPAANIPSTALLSGALVLHINTQTMPETTGNEYNLTGCVTDTLPSLLAATFGNFRPPVN